MTAQILVVEDDPKFVDAIREVLAAISPSANVKVAQSRDSAIALLNEAFFDFMVLDLRIPTSDGALDADSQHGLAVFRRTQTVASGTPVIVLTGSSADEFVDDLAQSAKQIDVWGDGRNVRTVDFLQKYKFDSFQDRVRPSIASIDALSGVELDRGTAALTTAEERLIRIFARRCDGRRVVVSELGGGLSGAKVLRLRVTNAQGAPLHDAVAKLGSLADVVDEGQRFDNQVTRLDQTATPRKLITLEAGAKASAGVFYGLAAGFEKTAFQAALSDPEHASAVVLSVEAATSRWRNDVHESPRTIREVRARLVSDATFAAALEQHELSWAREFEDKQIQARWCCGHGDLHGENVLVAQNGTAVIIDYGDVEDGTASLDPITLELSLLFHSNGPLRGVGDSFGTWPSEVQASAWGDIDRYVVGCPAEAFVRACRTWAYQSAAGKREIAATAYAYLVRQLKYADTNKALALALLNGVKAYYDAT